MNENWYWQLAQDRQRELRREADQARLLKEAGIQDSAPAVLKALGVFLLILPVAFIAARVAGKL
jgi:hypothetical protein